MELAGVHITEVKDPQKNFPKGLMIAALFIMTTMLLGSLSIAIVLPEKEINLVSGVIQVFSFILTEFHLQSLLPLIVLAIVLGSTGGIINWLTSPAKGLLHAAEFGFLPTIFTKKNSYNVPYVIMLMQAIIVSICCFVLNFVPSVNTFYWYLTGLSTNLYMMMYVLLFLSAIKLSRQNAFKDSIFKIAKTPLGLNLTAILGLFGAILTIIVGFFPAKELGIKNQLGYAIAILGGMIGMVICCLGFFRYKKNQLKKLK
jgi:amino acid transporter